MNRTAGNILAAATFLAVVPVAFAQPERDPTVSIGAERLESYLTELNLLELQAEHLTQRLESAEPGDERERIVERLARIYAQLLGRAETLTEQRVWERRAEDLLATADGTAALDLQLGLARAAYARVEDLAEQWVLRLASPSEREETAQRLEELHNRMLAIAGTADRAVERFENREENVPDAALDAVEDALAQARRQRSMAHYLAGWTAYYRAELETTPAERDEWAETSLVQFGYLLNAPRGEQPTADRAPVATFRFEHVGRSALVVSTALATLDRAPAALAWLDLAEEAERLHPAAREQLFIRRAIAFIRTGRWEALRAHIDDRDAANSPGPMTVGEARRLAVEILEAERTASISARDRALAQHARNTALADLVAQGELGHVLDLAERYGFTTLGDVGFVANQVRGLVLYGDARENHRALASTMDDTSPDDPVTDPTIAEDYRAAASRFADALDAEDAAEFPRALAQAAMLRGLALYYAGRNEDADAPGLLEAAQVFLDAAAGFDANMPSRAADALAMAIRAYDLQIEAMGPDDPASEAISADRLAVVRRLLEQHPAHERAAALILQRAADDSLSVEQRLELLERIPASSAVAELAERQAARLAWQAFKEAGTDRRPFLASRYVELAEPLLVIDRRRAAADADASEAAELALMRARRIVEAIMATRPPDLTRAERTLGVIDGLLDIPTLNAPGVADELRYRRAQVALARGDDERAEQLLEPLISGNAADAHFAEAARRLFFRTASERFERARSSNNADRLLAAAEQLIRYGGRLADAFLGEPADERPVGALSVFAAVADASMVIWQQTGDDAALARALRLYEEVLDAEPRNPRILRGAAGAAEASALDDRALDLWRRLLSGLQRGSNEWFEVKFRHAAALARTDPQRAEQVLAQHQTLYPNWGPDPWGDKLRSLSRELSENSGAAR